jgi:hypothetical protein
VGFIKKLERTVNATRTGFVPLNTFPYPPRPRIGPISTCSSSKGPSLLSRHKSAGRGIASNEALFIVLSCDGCRLSARGVPWLSAGCAPVREPGSVGGTLGSSSCSACNALGTWLDAALLVRFTWCDIEAKGHCAKGLKGTGRRWSSCEHPNTERP